MNFSLLHYDTKVSVAEDHGKKLQSKLAASLSGIIIYQENACLIDRKSQL